MPTREDMRLPDLEGSRPEEVAVPRSAQPRALQLRTSTELSFLPPTNP